MTPAARVQAAIEIFDAVIAAARASGPPADRILVEWFRTRRFAGSGDRRAVRELVYRAIRACGDIPQSGRAALLLLAQADPVLAGLFDGSRHGPAVIEADEPVALPGLAPTWLEARLANSGITGREAQALLERAPLDVRVNTLRTGVTAPPGGEPTVAPHGLRFPAGTAIEQTPQFAAGAIEVQDTGSQLACLAVGARPGETVIDLCAGAGGKTLALAAAMENRGALVACDTDRGRLARLGPRAQRAGAAIAETVLLDPGREAHALARFAAGADAVLVDAPCSGTGTWRRNPEARWRITPAQIDRYVAAQTHLLGVGAQLVRPGGRLCFVTCSLLDAEGPDRIAQFLGENGDWSVDLPELPAGRQHGDGVRLTPHHDGTDGFFIARLVRIC